MKRLGFIFLLGFLAGCDTDEDAAPLGDPIFTFEVSGDVLVGPIDYWVVVRDAETGELIDSKEIQYKGPAVEFRTDKTISGKLSITFLKYDEPYYVKIYVYNDIDVGTKWNASYPFPGTKPVTIPDSESHPFEINDVPNMYGFGSSDLFGQNIDGNLDFRNNKVTGSVSFHDGGTQQMFMIDEGVKPKYKFIDTPAPGAEINFNYGEMQDFDYYMTTTFPLHSDIEADVTVLDTTQSPYSSYLLYSRELSFPESERDFLQIGFLNRFQNYTVDARIGSQYFHSVGPAPKFIDYIGPENFSVSTNSVNDFSLTTQYQYTYAKTLYGYSRDDDDKNISYQLYYFTTPENQKHFDLLTPELLKRYKIDKDAFVFDNTEVHWWRGRLYADVISYGYDPKFNIFKPAQEAWVVIRRPAVARRPLSLN